MSVATIAAVIALLVSVSATYNAYVLRGGKLAWSQVLTALATVALMLSLVLGQVAEWVKLSDPLAILGFLLLFAGSLKLRNSLK